jgi:hypothetical protein
LHLEMVRMDLFFEFQEGVLRAELGVSHIQIRRRLSSHRLWRCDSKKLLNIGDAENCSTPCQLSLVFRIHDLIHIYRP